MNTTTIRNEDKGLPCWKIILLLIRINKKAESSDFGGGGFRHNNTRSEQFKELYNFGRAPLITYFAVDSGRLRPPPSSLTYGGGTTKVSTEDIFYDCDSSLPLSVDEEEEETDDQESASRVYSAVYNMQPREQKSSTHHRGNNPIAKNPQNGGCFRWFR